MNERGEGGGGGLEIGGGRDSDSSVSAGGRAEPPESRCSHGDPQSFIIIQSTEIEQPFGEHFTRWRETFGTFQSGPPKICRDYFRQKCNSLLSD